MSREQAENLVGGALFLVVIVLILVLLIRRITGGSALGAVLEEFAVGGNAADHAAKLQDGLRSVRRARLEQHAPGQFVLVVRRSPNWTLAFLPLFGLGLVLSLAFSRDWRLGVFLYDSEEGAHVRLAGETEQRILARARAVVAGLDARGSVDH